MNVSHKLIALTISLAVAAGCQRSDQATTGADAPATQQVPAAAAKFAEVDGQRLQNAAGEPSQWMTYGGTYSERHFSNLDQIDTGNVSRLGLAWFADYDTNLTQTGTPLYIDGVIYVSTAWSKVYAFDARTGAQLWYYNPKVPGEWAVKVCCGLVNRGIAAYDGKIYVGTLDGRLIALDAATGEEVWSKLTIDPDQRYSITSAPRVVKGKVLIGNSGGEFGVRGYIGAYDAQTGEEAWRFYTVPGNPADGFENEAMARAADTWGGEWWKLGGGGTVWDAIVYDPESDLVYFGTGNGTPWNQRDRDPTGGDNLYLASIVAVRPDTGEYVWHYQTTPGDTWDYDAVSPMMLLDIELDGKPRHALVQPCKNGFLYVLDAASGKLLSADPFTTVNWADGVNLETGRPNVRPEARYEIGSVFNLAPGVQGAHGWHANSYNPSTGLMYIPTQRAYFPMIAEENYQPSEVGYNLGLDFAAPFTYYRDHPDVPSEFVGYVIAWDPATGREVWRGEENQGPTGGTLATAGGLVFHSGGSSNEFRAYDARSGEKLWNTDVQTGVVAAPISYEIDGTQYVAVSVGGGTAAGYFAPNHSRLLVFKLDGTTTLPTPVEYVPRPLNPPVLTASAEEIELGRQQYSQYCAACHGTNGQTRGATFPNLMVTPLLHTQEGFDQVVLQGVRAERGMASFAQVLEPRDSAAILAYVVSLATAAKDAAPTAAAGPTVNQPHEDIE